MLNGDWKYNYRKKFLIILKFETIILENYKFIPRVNNNAETIPIKTRTVAEKTLHELTEIYIFLNCIWKIEVVRLMQIFRTSFRAFSRVITWL
jgi:hypothetical protein